MTRAGAVVLLIGLWSPLAVNAQSVVDSGVTDPGIYQLTLPDSERRYTLAIPDGYTGQEPTPLIVSLHYGGRVTPFYGRGLVEFLAAGQLIQHLEVGRHRRGSGQRDRKLA